VRNVFVDLGAHVGSASESFGMSHPEYELIAIEPNIELIPSIHTMSKRLRRPLAVIWAAAWTRDGTINLFKSEHDVASTVVPGKQEYTAIGWSQIDYSAPHVVPSLDLSTWLFRNLRRSDHVVIKMDIEGAEYDVLEKLLVDGSISLVSELMCEWHADRFPEIPRSRHDQIREQVSRRVKLHEWG
jgi:FkbM family methyltransferase